MIIRDDRDGIAVVRLAHGTVSALDAALCEALVHEVEGAASGPVRGLVLTGSGGAFSAGVDLFKVLAGGTEYLRGFLPALEALFTALVTFPKPLVAAVNGHAIAGGCIMVCACDHRVMAEGTARIGVPELAVGVPFPTLPFEIVRARVTPAVLRDLVFSGRTVAPAEALALGLVDEIAPPDVLITRALHVAAELARIPAVSYRLTRRAFAEPLLDRVRQAAPLNADVLEAWESPEVQARVRAYLDQTVGKK